MSYEVTDPTVDSQIIQIKNSGANVFFNDAAPKAAAQAIRKVADLGWKPAHISPTSRPRSPPVLKPAGFDNSKGIITAAYLKDATDPQWADYPDFKEWQAWMEKYHARGQSGRLGQHLCLRGVGHDAPRADPCGDTLTRENLMKQAASMKGLEVPLLLPGIKINTSPTDFYPIQSVRLARFDGEKWELFGDVLSNEGS